MTVTVSDTSALVSLGTVATHRPSALSLLVDNYQVCVPEQVVSELQNTAAYDDRSGEAAEAVLDCVSEFDIHDTIHDKDFPLDNGENAAVSLANDLDASLLLCDEFNSLSLMHASLIDTHLVTTPSFLIALVKKEYLEPEDAEVLLSEIGQARSWETNAYVSRASSTLQQMIP